MDRKQYLEELFLMIETQFGLDLSKDKKGIKFAYEAFRKKQTPEEALDYLQTKLCLIKILPNDKQKVT
tara:strand:- start:49 stop:252 length:204 start_codon:yes stop_codon:yes gene_type:complete